MKLQHVLVGLIALAFVSCKEDELCLTGSGTVNQYDLELADFDRIALYGPINLRIKQGSDQVVQVLAEPEMMEVLDYKVKNGELEIGYKDNIRCFETDYGVWVQVTLDDLSTIYASGVNEIVSDGAWIGDQLEIITSGTATVLMTGELNHQIIKSSGTVNVYNYDLLSTKTSVDISGTGNLEVSCSEELDLTISGAATISYKGTPAIRQEVSGTLNLVNAN